VDRRRLNYSSGQITLDPQNFGRKQQDKKRSICQSYLVVGISHTRLFFCLVQIFLNTTKVSCGKFPRRDPTGKLTFFYPAASCRNSGGPELSVRCCTIGSKNLIGTLRAFSKKFRASRCPGQNLYFTCKILRATNDKKNQSGQDDGQWFPPPKTVIFLLLSDQVLDIFQKNSKRIS